MPAIPNHLRSIVNSDGAAVLDPMQGTLTTLNETGAYVWQALGRGDSEEAIVRALAEATGESAEVIAVDLRAFLTTLTEHKMLGPQDEERLS